MLASIGLPGESQDIITKKHNPRRPHIVITHHDIDQIGYSIDECPDPFVVGL
jgi:hypothetical protein